MTTAEQMTGVKDEHYDLVSILYHALQGAETYQTYINDADRARWRPGTCPVLP